MNTKLLFVILIVLGIVFVVFTVIGVAREDDAPLDLDLAKSFGSRLADILLSDVDIQAIQTTPGSDLVCLEKTSAIARIPINQPCVYRIAPPTSLIADITLSPVRQLSLTLLTGRCLHVTLDNQAGDALSTELYLVADDLPPDTYTGDKGCAKPDKNPNLTLFEKSGDILTLTCEDGDSENALCEVKLN